MKQDWLDSIRKRMDSYEETVPEGLWESIEASVIKKEKPSRKPVFIPWMWTVAAAAAVALGVFVGVRLTDKDNIENIRTAESQESRASSTTNPSSSVDITVSPAPSVDPSEPVTVIEDKRAPLVAMASVPSPVSEPVSEPEVEVAVPSEAVPSEPVRPQEVRPEEKQPEKYTGPTEKSLEALDMEDMRSIAEPPVKKDRLRGLSAGFSFTGSSANSEDVNTVESRSFFLGSASALGYSDSSTPMTKAVSEPVTKDEKHRRPVRASLTLSYPMGDKFAIESGLTYSILYSTFTTISGETVYEDAQTLGYLGVPLNLRMNVLSKDHYTIYALGGGIMEKCLKATSKTTTTVGGVVVGNPDVRNLTVKPLLWSVNASAGLQLCPMDKVGLFVEPGLSYHFDNNSKVRSVYTEHPLDFILTFGARISLK
ncbi:MAG: hypothetical protein IK076_02655 [Bacteroidales bacterium]|nr:hypothetical protein [Bacteroidales bacterium]